jgi:ribosomal protein L13E
MQCFSRRNRQEPKVDVMGNVDLKENLRVRLIELGKRLGFDLNASERLANSMVDEIVYLSRIDFFGRLERAVENWDFDRAHEIRPMVMCPRGHGFAPRLGRGFSAQEIRGSGLNIDELRRMRIPVDDRRSTEYDANEAVLREIAAVLKSQRIIRGEGSATTFAAVSRASGDKLVH